MDVWLNEQEVVIYYIILVSPYCITAWPRGSSMVMCFLNELPSAVTAFLSVPMNGAHLASPPARHSGLRSVYVFSFSFSWATVIRADAIDPLERSDSGSVK